MEKKRVRDGCVTDYARTFVEAVWVMCVHVQLVHEDEGIQECLPADVARVRGHTVVQKKGREGRPRG